MTSESREQAIREIAYSKWEQAGAPTGDGLNFWLEAEQAFFEQQMSESACDHDAIHGSSGAAAICDPPPLLLAKVKATSRKKAG